MTMGIAPIKVHHYYYYYYPSKISVYSIEITCRHLQFFDKSEALMCVVLFASLFLVVVVVVVVVFWRKRLDHLLSLGIK